MVNRDKHRTLDKLSKRADFLNASNNGHKVYSGKYLIANFVDNSLERVRCGWTIPKYVGSAVTRNRIRRWCREYFRAKLVGGWNPALDINIVLKRQDKVFYKNLTHSEFKRALAKLQQKIESIQK